MDEVKIYGLCLVRLAHQIRKAKERLNGGANPGDDRVLMESYTTGDIDEIIDILELYDLEEHTQAAVREKLSELAYTVSLLTRETISFGFTNEGHLGLYLEILERSPREEGEEEIVAAGQSVGL